MDLMQNLQNLTMMQQQIQQMQSLQQQRAPMEIPMQTQMPSNTTKPMFAMNDPQYLAQLQHYHQQQQMLQARQQIYMQHRTTEANRATNHANSPMRPNPNFTSGGQPQ